MQNKEKRLHLSNESEIIRVTKNTFIMSDSSTLQSYVQKGKKEILTDIADGTVPDTITSFSDLHDYVDANTYCGFCDDGHELSEGMVFENEVQEELNTWIQSPEFQTELTKI